MNSSSMPMQWVPVVISNFSMDNFSTGTRSMSTISPIHARGGVVSAKPLTIAEAWGWAFLFVTIINLSSVMGIIFFPLMKKSFYTIVMRAMIGLAIGSLSGSALFHLIPAAFELGEENEKGQKYRHIAAFIWISIWIIMLLECTIKIVVKTKTMKQRKNNSVRMVTNRLKNNNHSKTNGDGPPIESRSDVNDDEEDKKSESSFKASLSRIPVYHSTFSLNKTAIEALTEEDDLGENPPTIKTVAWLIIIGDSLHNFIDGVSIGAAFVNDFWTGAIISLAIMCEEFPHELGDFAILISSGFTVKKALLVNFLSALTCYLGMALGILLGEIQWQNYIFAFAAGIFLYVSLADMIPEITTVIEELSGIAPDQAWKVLLSHNIGILVGISILYALAVYLPV